ncbi:MAG TPA: PQQ-binding-like beta-propeller repeat protein, partial [Candidatus Bathyarchaeia archaeon]
MVLFILVLLTKTFYAVSAKDGTKSWSFSTGGNIFPSPAVANNIVYIGSDDHNVYALNAQNGDLV